MKRADGSPDNGGKGPSTGGGRRSLSDALTPKRLPQTHIPLFDLQVRRVLKNHPQTLDASAPALKPTGLGVGETEE